MKLSVAGLGANLGMGGFGGNDGKALPSLHVTGGNFTLIRSGHHLLDITDGTDPVVGCTITPTDPSKADVYSGYTIEGIAGSGSTVLTVSKPGYLSAVVTVTCSSLDLLLTARAGTSTTTNGAANTDWTDQFGAVAYSEPTNAPLYIASSLNGLPGLRFDGTNARLNTSAPVPALDGAALSLFVVCAPSAAGDSRAQSRQILNAITSGSFLGWNIVLDSANKMFISVGSGSAFLVPAPITTSTYTGGAGRYITLQIANGAQLLRVDGITEDTDTAAYSPNTANVSRMGTNSGDTGNRFPGDINEVYASSRTWTSTEYQQLELMAQNLYAL